MAEAQKKRGRPSKKQTEEAEPVADSVESDEAAEVSDEPEAKKGRGKPKTSAKPAAAVAEAPKRGRGRPKSKKASKAKPPAVPGRGRGRPPKDAAPAKSTSDASSD